MKELTVDFFQLKWVVSKQNIDLRRQLDLHQRQNYFKAL